MTDTNPPADRATEPAARVLYPEFARFKGGRVRHLAHTTARGDVQTACKKRRWAADNGNGLPLCADCATRDEHGRTPAEAGGSR